MRKEDERDASLTLGILQAIDNDSDVTQRHLASELGVALGLANSYLRRCVRKGLVKIQQAPANRYLYYLTPKGLAEKGRLTAEYLAASFDYYNRAGQSVRKALMAIEQTGARTVLFAGASELAEIASVRMHDFELDVVGTFDPGFEGGRFVGRPVWKRIEDAADYDAVIYTRLDSAADDFHRLQAAVGHELVFVPEIIAATLVEQPQGAVQ